MKKKYLIALVAVILCACIGIGIFQATSGDSGTAKKGDKGAKASQSQSVDEGDEPMDMVDDGGTDLTDDPNDPNAQMGKDGKRATKYANAGKHTQAKVAAGKNKKKKKTTSSTTETTKKGKKTTSPGDRLNKKGLKNRLTTKKRTTTKATTTTTTTTAKKTTTTTKKTTTTRKLLTVNITITCKNAVNAGKDIDPTMLKKTTLKVDDGTTVFDALKLGCKKDNIAIKYEKTSAGIYVTSIGGLAEKACGETSGWMFEVNGKAPNKACDKVVLKAGDTIEWYYVTSPEDKP